MWVEVRFDSGSIEVKGKESTTTPTRFPQRDGGTHTPTQNFSCGKTNNNNKRIYHKKQAKKDENFVCFFVHLNVIFIIAVGF